MNTTVETLIKKGDRFIPIGDYSGTLPDENYIEGAICCEIGGQSILGKEHWDLVDQLWVYVVEGLVTLSRDETYECSFPDQPLHFRLVPHSDYYIDVTIGETSYRVDRVTFISAMKEGAERFFTTIKSLCPGSTDTWDRYLEEVQSM